MERNDIINLYRNNGMAVFKLLGKRPQIREWQQTPVESLEAYGHPGNIGANLPEDIVVIDIDPRNFPKDRNPAVELFQACGMQKPDTLKVVTGTGGLHVYFRKPKGIVCKSNLDKLDFPGIDIKTRNIKKGVAKGAYVVMPTSVHPVTKKKYVLKGDCTSIMDIPEALLRIIESPQDVGETIENKSPDLGENDIEVARMQYINYLQKAPGAVEGHHGDQDTYQVACKGRDFGLDITNTYWCMLEYWNDRCDPPWGEDQLALKVKNAFEYAVSQKGIANIANKLDEIEIKEEVVEIQWDLGKDGNPKKTLYNAVNYFKLPSSGLSDLLVYNEFTHRVEFAKCPPWHSELYRVEWADEDITACRYYLSSRFGFEIHGKIIDEAARTIALRNRTHPVRDYLNSLEWDGKARMNTWLSKYGKVPKSIFTREVGRKLLIGAVARIFNPGCKFDYVTVIEGKQGYRKSTLVSVLGGEWYADIDTDPKSKDTIQAIMGKWFVELSEMETSRKSEANALKSFITRQTDRIRLPYEKYTADIKRQCVFIGTINPEVGIGYLKDSTGNRRFWCVEVEDYCDVEGLAQVRDQLFAEALAAYRGGERPYIDKEDVNELALAEADKRAGGDPWESVIDKTLQANRDVTEIRPAELYGLALGGRMIDFGIKEKVRIQRAMKALGWRYEIINGENGREDWFKKYEQT